jgi:hypothetical protein
LPIFAAGWADFAAGCALRGEAAFTPAMIAAATVVTVLSHCMGAAPDTRGGGHSSPHE